MPRKSFLHFDSLCAAARFLAVPSIFLALTAVAQLPAGIPGHVSSARSTLQNTVVRSSDAPLFQPPVLYDSGGLFWAGSNRGLALADINGDGYPDVVVSNSYSNTLGVLLNNRDGTFQPAVTYNSGGAYPPSSVAIADVNDDGKPDLIVANSSGPYPADHAFVAVLMGNGDGTFQSPVTYDAGALGELSDVVVADVNGDRKLDLVVAYFTGSIAVLLGNGDGTFWAPILSRLPSANDSIAIADVNNDGKPDLLATHGRDGWVGVSLGNGDGTFRTEVEYNSGAIWPGSFAVTDVNGDSKPDLVVANGGYPDGIVSILLGNGDGTFQPAKGYDSGGTFGRALAVADVNGDGKPDVVVANLYTSNVGVLLGNGDGTFQPALTYDSGYEFPNSIVIADVNGDGAPDLLIQNRAGANCCDGYVAVLLNNAPVCTTPPTITFSASPKLLWPPNGEMVPVKVSGKITDAGTGCTVKSATYTVTDEYGEVQPSGPVTLGPGDVFSFTVLLRASRFGTDIDGRLYTVIVTAGSNSNKTSSRSGTVVVPHDQAQ